MNNLEILFLGTRGSIPIDSSYHMVYGGATTCTMIKANGQYIVFDAGTGFMNISDYLEIDEKSGTTLHLFVSHPHLDHILGLMACNYMFHPSVTIHIYGKSRDGLTIREQLEKLMVPPIWPVGVNSFSSTVIFHDVSDEIHINDITIYSIEGNHPGGCSVFRLEYKDSSIVYATDYEITEDTIQKLIDFSQDASLLICDGQYCDSNIAEKIGFGHSAWQSTVLVAQKASCHRLCITHHDPYSDDIYLTSIDNELKKISAEYFLAQKGRSIIL